MASPYESRKRKAIKSNEEVRAALAAYNNARQELHNHQSEVHRINGIKNRIEKDEDYQTYVVGELERDLRKVVGERERKLMEQELAKEKQKKKDLWQKRDDMMDEWHEIMRRDNFLSGKVDDAKAALDKAKAAVNARITGV